MCTWLMEMSKMQLRYTIKVIEINPKLFQPFEFVLVTGPGQKTDNIRNGVKAVQTCRVFDEIARCQ